MDHDTREAVGRLARWCLLGVAAAGGLLAVTAELSALEPTFRAGRARVVLADAAARVDRYARLPVISRPPLGQTIPGYYWRDSRGRLSELYISRKSQTAYFPLGENVPPGRLRFHAVANPYSAYAPGWGGASVFLYPPNTPLVAVDTRAILTGPHDDRSDPHAPGAPAAGTFHLAAEPGSLWLARLAEVRPVAYLAPVPLETYDACRETLRAAPPGAVLAAADTWQRPADIDAMLETLRFTQQYLRHPVTLVTTDAALADAARHDDIPVVLVGVYPTAVDRGVNVRDWTAAQAWLVDQTP